MPATRAASQQVPTLNKMKQNLHQLSVNFAQLTNEAVLLAWDPELEYRMHLLQEQLLSVKHAEDLLDDASGFEDDLDTQVRATSCPLCRVRASHSAASRLPLLCL